MQELPRLIYLADEHRPSIPKTILKYLPQGDLILEIAEHGLNQAILDGNLPEEQLTSMYAQGQKTRGKKLDRGSVDEFRMLVGQIVSSEVDIRREDLNFTDFLSLQRHIHDYVVHGGDELVATSEADLGGALEEEELPKFDSGFDPMDLVLGGMYQGIMTVIGKSGNGKTSVMLTLMEALRASNQVSEIWYYEVEIPLKLMLWKTRQMRERTQFVTGDKLRCGNFSTRDILEAIKENPDPNRVIMIDGPDAMAASAGEGKRFAIEIIYRDLLRIKEKSKMVVVSSQSRRKDGLITMESVAEAWSKVWYSDMILGVQKIGRAPNGLSSVKINSVKNRFGVEGREVTFGYNFSDLSWEIDELARTHMEEEEEW